MARKRAADTAPVPAPDSPTSPGNGAMDSLMEKLRAAGPQNRDQRDRRRRARLKEKHQMRIASGEQMPDLADITKGAENDGEDSSDVLSPPPVLPSVPEKEDLSEGEEIADRAAQLLQGIRGEASGDASGIGSIRVRRRREGKDGEERRPRRRPRKAAEDAGEPSPTTLNVTGDKEADKAEASPGTPVTTISPPTPEHGTEARPVSISD